MLCCLLKLCECSIFNHPARVGGKILLAFRHQSFQSLNPKIKQNLVELKFEREGEEDRGARNEGGKSKGGESRGEERGGEGSGGMEKREEGKE